MSFDREVPDILRALRLPVVAINSDIFPSDADALRRHGVELVVMPNTGHFLMMEDPERFNHLLATAMGRLAR